MLPAVVDVETARNPFDGHRVHGFAKEGETLSEMIAGQGLREDEAFGVTVTLNGEVIPARFYPRVKPKAGANVVIRVIPRGGDTGKAVLSILLSVLTIAAAIFMPQIGLASVSLLSWEGAMMAGVVAGGLMGIASGIQSLVAPPPQVPFSGDVPTSRDSAALTGTKNTARLYAPIRTVLGQYRVYPDLLAKPFTERVGKDSVLRLLMCFGYGPLQITDLRIGETSIDDIPSIRYNVLPGWDDDASLSIFRDDVTQDASFQPELSKEDGADEAGSEIPRILTTDTGPEEISFDLAFPAGLIAFSESGKPKEVTVRFGIKERELGEDDTAWANIGDPTMGVDYDDTTDTGVTKVSDGVFEITLAERGLVTRGFRWPVPSGSTPGVAHQIRVVRISTTTTVSNNNSIFSDARINVIRTIKPHVSSSIDNLAKIELEINASETGLSSIVDNLSALCTSIVPKYDTVAKTWGPTHGNASALDVSMFPSRNGAWLYAHMLRGPMNSRPIGTDRIDGPSIAAWAGHLDGTGSYATSGTIGQARSLDAVIDYSATTRQVLQDIAGAGRASLNIIDGKYGVVEDIPRTQIIQHFTPRNSSGFSGAKAFRKKPHAVRTHFVNPAKEYQRDERIVYADGYNEDGSGGKTEATEFTELSLWGVSDAEQAWRDARYHLASAQLRPEVFSITVDVEHIVCNRGDLVRVSHDVIGVGYGGARLNSVTNSGGAFVSATMDEEFHFAQYDADSAKSYAARIRTKDGNDLLVNVISQGESSQSLVAETPTSYGSNEAPAVGDLVLFGERTTESLLCLVQRISPRNDLTAMIELVEYNAAVYEPGTVPAHTSNISLQNQPTLLKPIKPEIEGSPLSDETASAYASSGSPEPLILVNVITPQHAEGTYAPTTHFHAQYRLKKNGAAATDWFNLPRIEATGDTRLAVRPVEEGETYDIRVRGISDTAATASDWELVADHTVVGFSTPPPAPTELSVWGNAIRWNYGTKPVDFSGFIVKHQQGDDATWATGIPLTENLITDNWVAIQGRIQPGSTTIMVRAVDINGNESEQLSALRTIPSPGDWPLVNAATSTGVWAGTKVNATVNAGTNYLEATVNSSSNFWATSDTSSFWNTDASTDMWDTTVYNEMSYEQSFYIYNDTYNVGWPGADHLPGRQRFSEIEVEGADYRIEYRASSNYDWSSGVYSWHTDWLPWPGERELEAVEYPMYGVSTLEIVFVRITIAGGQNQGRMKKLKIVTEARPKKHTIASATIPTGGYTADITGLGWRKVTNATVTPLNTADAAQGALIAEVYDVNAAQTTTAPYERTGPTIKLYDASDAAASGTASIVLEGY